MDKEAFKIGIVGPCAAGKSTLAGGLKSLGYRAKPIAQEHSYAPVMWQRITNPDILIFLDVSYEQSMKRRPMDWTKDEYEEQRRRLVHAREHADLYIYTDPLTPQQVLNQVENFLTNLK